MSNADFYSGLTHKSTKSAQNLPKNWIEQCEIMTERIALLVCKYKIPKELIVNTDQTGLLLVPTSAFSYNPTGSADCSVIGKNEKRQITAVVTRLSNSADAKWI